MYVCMYICTYIQHILTRTYIQHILTRTCTHARVYTHTYICTYGTATNCHALQRIAMHCNQITTNLHQVRTKEEAMSGLESELSETQERLVILEKEVDQLTQDLDCKMQVFVAVWCSVVQCGAVWCSVVMCCSVVQFGAMWCSVAQRGAAWCSVVQRGAMWCSVVQRGAAWCSIVQCVAVEVVHCCSGSS